MPFIHIVSTLFVAAVGLAFVLSYKDSVKTNISMKSIFVDKLLSILETLGVIIIIVSVSVELTDLITYVIDNFAGF